WRGNVFFQKISNSLVGIDLIFDASEAVPFILIDLELHNPAALLNSIRNLLRLRLGTAWIIASSQQQQWGLDAVNKIDVRAIFPYCFFLPGSANSCQTPLLQPRFFMLDLRKPVKKWHEGHACRPFLRRFRYSHHLNITAIAAAHGH